MSIEKKSLISTLKSAKKANVVKEEFSMEHGRNAVKAQPVLKLSAKAASKHVTAAKTAVKQ